MNEYEHLANTLNHILAILTIIAGLVLIIDWGCFLYSWHKKKFHRAYEYVARWVFPVGFLASFGGVFMTLFYSEILRYAPCDLCWYQRVFLYPQAFIFAYAWYKKDYAVLPYTAILSFVGFALGVYHHALQMGYDMYKPCSSAPFAVDCAKPSFVEFGFVTFPLMSAVLFAFLALLSLATYVYKKERKG
jgi:disulfide bond formation protein DsbB